jgi:hypothetical protein
VALFITTLAEVCRRAIRIIAQDTVSVVPVKESCWAHGTAAFSILNTAVIHIRFSAFSLVTINVWRKNSLYKVARTLELIASTCHLTANPFVSFSARCVFTSEGGCILLVHGGMWTMVCGTTALLGATMCVVRGLAI